MVKASAAKIISLGAFRQIGSLYSLVPNSIRTSCTCVFGARRMNKHHTITEKTVGMRLRRIPTVKRHLGNGIEVVQSTAIQKRL